MGSDGMQEAVTKLLGEIIKIAKSNNLGFAVYLTLILITILAIMKGWKLSEVLCLLGTLSLAALICFYPEFIYVIIPVTVFVGFLDVKVFHT